MCIKTVILATICLLSISVHLVKAQEQVGAIAAEFVNTSGEPLEGLYVYLDGTDRFETTDRVGSIFFTDVPAGRVSLSFAKVFGIEEMGDITTHWATLENVGPIPVHPFEVTRIEGTIAAPELLRQSVCRTKAWAKVAVLIVPLFGFGIVAGSSGVVGTCSCTVFTAGLPGPAACPGAGPALVVPLPPPGALRLVVTETCLGDAPECPQPIDAESDGIWF